MAEQTSFDDRVKTALSELAVFGGKPLFARPRYVNTPYCADRDAFLRRVETALDAFWLTNDGPLVQELEERLAAQLGVDHCVLMSNGTAAMELTIEGLGVRGEVILPAFTFVSTAHTLLRRGLTPVFCDIEPDSHNISPDACRVLLGPKTSAVIATHVWGKPCDVASLEALCREAGIALIFDAAHAFGCTHQGVPIGRFGNAEVFSFHATKAFQTVEGGAVTTNDAVLAERLRSMRNFGFAGYDRVESIGTNAKLSEIHAAMGLVNLDHFEDTRARARAVYEAYAGQLQSVEGVDLMELIGPETGNYQYCVLGVDESRFGLSRDQLMTILHAERALARRYFYPGTHRYDPYRERFGEAESRLARTRAACDTVLVLPAAASMAPGDARALGGLIGLIGTHANAIGERLRDGKTIAQ